MVQDVFNGTIKKPTVSQRRTKCTYSLFIFFFYEKFMSQMDKRLHE